jgi:hypothetical protein
MTEKTKRTLPRELLHPAFRPEDPNDEILLNLRKNSGWADLAAR